MKEDKGQFRGVVYDDESYSKSKYLACAKDAQDYPFYRYVRGVIQRMGSKSVLDIGCGVGWLYDVVKDDVDYTGVDHSRVAIDRALARTGHDQFYVDDAIAFLLKTDLTKFDTIIMMEFLEHQMVDTPIFDLIPKGMKVIITVPSYWSEGHVRFFDNEVEVTNYYSMIRGSMDSFIFPGGSRVFIKYGERA